MTGKKSGSFEEGEIIIGHFGNKKEQKKKDEGTPKESPEPAVESPALPAAERDILKEESPASKTFRNKFETEVGEKLSGVVKKADEYKSGIDNLPGFIRNERKINDEKTQFQGKSVYELGREINNLPNPQIIDFYIRMHPAYTIALIEMFFMAFDNLKAANFAE